MIAAIRALAFAVVLALPYAAAAECAWVLWRNSAFPQKQDWTVLSAWATKRDLTDGPESTGSCTSTPRTTSGIRRRSSVFPTALTRVIRGRDERRNKQTIRVFP